jgi:hypothetical protein
VRPNWSALPRVRQGLCRWLAWWLSKKAKEVSRVQLLGISITLPEEPRFVKERMGFRKRFARPSFVRLFGVAHLSLRIALLIGWLRGARVLCVRSPGRWDGRRRC